MKWLLIPSIALMLCGAPAAATPGEDLSGRSLVILSPDEADGRLAALREAVAFWNQTLSELHVRSRLLEPEVVVGSPFTRKLEGYAFLISQAGGHFPHGSKGPKQPAELAEIHGDIIVLLSTQSIFTFTWPISDPDRYFLAIQTDRVPPLDAPGVSRNVIAHELGHALGLVHNGDETSLMCSPCRSEALKPDSPFLPLTPGDRARLIELDQSR
jgi:hypothetical protein